MRTVRDIAADLINNKKCILSESLQDKLKDIVEHEDEKLWAACNRSVNTIGNKVMLRRLQNNERSLT